MERPCLAELIAYARKGDTLAVVRLDRLGRSLAELLTTVETLRGQGIALLSLEEKIDTSSAAGELIFHVFGAIAHFERRLISERTRSEEHTSELQSLIRISYAVFCLKKKKIKTNYTHHINQQ